MIDLGERELVVIEFVAPSSRAGSKGVFRDSFVTGEVHKLCLNSQSYVSKKAPGAITICWRQRHRYEQPLLNRSRAEIMARIVPFNSPIVGAHAGAQ